MTGETGHRDMAITTGGDHPAPDEPLGARGVATVLACYLGWTLDAFDYFIVAFVVDDVARSFGASVGAASLAFLLTLACRPVGAYLFGRFADRRGRKPALMAAIFCYSAVELASAAAPTLIVFLVLRALFGVALGGEWGVGASLTMESIPPRWRGPVSGLLQTGYPSGYLLASLLFLLEPELGWRGMFAVGALPALLVPFVWSRVPESPEWLERRRVAGPAEPSFLSVIRNHGRLVLFAVVLMAAFNFFSHGSQDLYPKVFLARELHFPHPTITLIVVLYNLGAIAGGLFFGTISQRIGRRPAIAIAALLALPLIPLFAYSTTPLRVAIGATLMQFCVQGAWGMVPAYLSELSPPSVRATFPGLTYQIGNLIASPNAQLQMWIGGLLGGLAPALALVIGVVAIVIAMLSTFGPEGRKGRLAAR